MENNKFDTIRKLFSDKYLNSEIAIIENGDSINLIRKIPDHSISLILTDPPYHTTKKKNITGDRNFTSDDEYLAWIEEFAVEWKRILKFSGSIFCFCSSAMSAKLQMMFSKYFNILSEVVWTKPNAPGYDGWKQKSKKESLRQWYPHSERILFMEISFPNNLFRSYFGGQLTAWRKEAGLSTIQLAEITQSYGKINHGGAIANWEAGRNIPSEIQYNKIKEALSSHGVQNIPEYKDMIRPFNVTKTVEFTDVWNFENVRQYKGKHPAEKPIALLEHAIKSTTYEGDIVLDCFAGSGSTGKAAINLNRKAILFEIEKEWAKREVELLCPPLMPDLFSY